jgi:glycogen operon protein
VKKPQRELRDYISKTSEQAEVRVGEPLPMGTYACGNGVNFAFFSRNASYSSAGGLGQQKLEFKEMVQAFHRAGIEVILDVVFNHTAEGNEQGPTLCFRGIDNTIFYMLADDKSSYKDYTGTGNTVNANHPVVRDHILAALRYWMIEMHVDGFRFDLASVLGRGRSGNLLTNSPLIERIAEDPILRDVKIIAEASDTAGAYEVGSFSEKRWAEWNGHYVSGWQEWMKTHASLKPGEVARSHL